MIMIREKRWQRRGSSANVQHVVRHMERRDSSPVKYDKDETGFILSSFRWLKPLTDEGRTQTRVIIIIMIIVIIIIIIITIAIIIIAFKGAIRDFYNLLTAPRTISNTHAQVARAQSCANHVQHIERLSRATCRVTCHLVQRDSSDIKFDRVEIAFI